MEELRKMLSDAIYTIAEDTDLSKRVKEISLDWKQIETMTTIEIRPVVKIAFYEET